MRIRVFVVGLVTAALVGCGGGSSSSDEDSADAGGQANSAEVRKLLEQTFGANSKASSGVLSGTVDITIAGVPRYRRPIQLTMSGPFSDAGGEPEANLTVGLSLRDTAFGGELILVDGQALIGLGSTAFRIPDSISDRIRRPLEAVDDNALGAVLAAVGIAPRRWAKDPRVVGNETIAGEETIHGTAEIDARRFFVDVARLVRLLTSLRITEIAGIPRAVDKRARAALVRSITSAKGDVYTGADDKVLRKAAFDMKLEMSARDRRILGGISAMTIKGELLVSDVGSTPALNVPSDRGSFDQLQLALDALGEAARRDGGS